MICSRFRPVCFITSAQTGSDSDRGMPHRSLVMSTQPVAGRVLDGEGLDPQVVALGLARLVAAGVPGHPERFGRA